MDIKLVIRALEDYNEDYDGTKEEFVEEWINEYYREKADFYEDYYNDPEVQYGWYNEDMCAMRYMER